MLAAAPVEVEGLTSAASAANTAVVAAAQLNNAAAARHASETAAAATGSLDAAGIFQFGKGVLSHQLPGLGGKTAAAPEEQVGNTAAGCQHRW
jgi:hypothetical protein